MTIKTDTITGPAFLASALINGDSSGLTDAEIEVLADFEANLDGWRIVGVTDDEPRFTWHFAEHGGNAKGGDVVDYIVHRNR